MFFKNDTLEKVTDFPPSSVGAPIPIALAAENAVWLCYITENVSEAWGGTTTKMYGVDTADETVAVISFHRCWIHKFGTPNDEAISGHPLYKKGLKPYSVFKVLHSSWIAELERMNSVHPYHDKKRFEALNHFIFTFHDSTFECAAEGVVSDLMESL